MGRITPDIITRLKSKQKLSKMGHFHQNYGNSADLKHQFGKQLVRLLPALTG